MSAPFVIPFNNCPISVSVKTASYTIPAGKYAEVYVEVDSGGIFTINAVNAVVTAAFVNVDVSGSGSASYTVPTGFMASINGFSSNAYGVNINGNGASSESASKHSNSINLGPAGTAVATVSLNPCSIQGLATPSNSTNRQATFWVPTGTVISGSGNWKAVVQEYNVIS